MSATIIHSTPVYQAFTVKDGPNGEKLKKYWQGHVLQDGNLHYIQASFWQDTASGKSKVQFSDMAPMTSKNVGRANETTPRDQAFFELNSTVQKQRDKRYHLPEENISDLRPKPMLAKPFDKAHHLITYPCSLNHKYDGFRALCDGKVFWTRQDNDVNSECVKHLLGNQAVAKPQIKQITLDDMFASFQTPSCVLPPAPQLEGYILDGELILPPPYGLEATISASKVYDPQRILLYRVYDIADAKLTYPERYEIASFLVKKLNNPNIILAPRWVVNNEEEIMEYHARFVEEGHEGTIIRTHHRGYAQNHRDDQLIKLKNFIEEEFPVVDIVDGPKAKGEAILVCKTEEGKLFRASLGGSRERRRHIFEHPEEVIGKIWTIRYGARTAANKSKPEEGNVPKFSTAINERDEALQGTATLG